MAPVAVFLLVIVQIPAVSRAVWSNSFGNPLFFACPSNKILNYVRSQHHNLYEDRRFEFKCRPEEGQRFCYWSGYANDYRDLMVFQCRGGGFINGMHSNHRNRFEDRKWIFYCCRKPNYHTANCYYTDWLNAYDDPFTLNVAHNHYIRGVVSPYSLFHRDRKFLFEICSLRRNFRAPQQRTLSSIPYYYNRRHYLRFPTTTTRDIISNSPPSQQGTLSLIPHRYNGGQHLQFPITTTSDLISDTPPPRQGTLSLIPHHHSRGHLEFPTTTTGDNIISDSPPPQQGTLSLIPHHHTRGHLEFPTTTTGDIIPDTPPPHQGTLSLIPLHHTRGHIEFPTTTTGDIISDSPIPQQGTLSSEIQSDDV